MSESCNCCSKSSTSTSAAHRVPSRIGCMSWIPGWFRGLLRTCGCGCCPPPPASSSSSSAASSSYLGGGEIPHLSSHNLLGSVGSYYDEDDGAAAGGGGGGGGGGRAPRTSVDCLDDEIAAQALRKAARRKYDGKTHYLSHLELPEAKRARRERHKSRRSKQKAAAASRSHAGSGGGKSSKGKERDDEREDEKDSRDGDGDGGDGAGVEDEDENGIADKAGSETIGGRSLGGDGSVRVSIMGDSPATDSEVLESSGSKSTSRSKGKGEIRGGGNSQGSKGGKIKKQSKYKKDYDEDTSTDDDDDFGSGTSNEGSDIERAGGNAVLVGDEEEGIEMEDLTQKQVAVPHRKLTKLEFFDRVDFLLALCEALHRYGLPTHRLEYQITWAALMSCMFKRVGSHKSYTYNINSEASWDLDKLEQTDQLADKVAKNLVSLRSGIKELKAIYDRPPKYPWWIKLFCMTIQSGVIAPWFFGGGLVEAGVSMICGLMVGLLVMLADRSIIFARLLEPLSAFLVAFFVGVFGYTQWFGPIDTVCILLSGVVWCLPGLQINTAIFDLATHMMVSGTARLLFATLILFELGFGLALGLGLSSLFPEESLSSSLSSSVEVSLPTIPLNQWLAILYCPIAAVSFGLLLGASPRQFVPIIIAACCATSVSMLNRVFGSEMATMVAQSSVIIMGNTYARIFKRPAFVPTCIGSLLLMPSSLGVRGITAVTLTNDVISAVGFTYALLLTAVSMVVGGFLGNMVAWPAKSL
ncbi:threonine/serine exporter family protein [Pelomyxa schiedti]|nr:threonine/serine exporter family protein [Pelomyxa schiedti]